VSAVFVRREVRGDEDAIDEVHAEAFARPESPDAVPPEVALVRDLRASAAWIPELSLVVVEQERIVGHVACTRATVAGRFDVLGLGPLGVAAARQHGGVGSALVHAVLGAADALGEPLVALLGANAYYARFGFAPSPVAGIDPPDPAYGAHFQVRLLTAARPEITGAFRYADAFDAL
jgi:putative acetyltransferase